MMVIIWEHVSGGGRMPYILKPSLTKDDTTAVLVDASCESISFHCYTEQTISSVKNIDNS